MKVNSRIELEFAGITLPISKDAEGRDIVPVKPISDVHGLSWADQHKKMQTRYLARRLGVCIGLIPYAGQNREMVCIRLDRVSAYLNQIEPERVRAAGNETGADFLEAKQEEWDDLIHEYETRQGGMMQGVSAETSTLAITVRLYLSVIRTKRFATDERELKALSSMAEFLAAKAGAPYQPDLIDGQLPSITARS